MSEFDDVDLTKTGSEMSALGKDLLDMQICIVAEMFVHAQNNYPNVSPQYVAKEIYASILLGAKSMREIMIEKYGGGPKGEHQVKYFEDALKKTQLKSVEDGSSDHLIRMLERYQSLDHD